MKPIICCGFTPCVQRIIEFEKVSKEAVNRALHVTIGVGGKGAVRETARAPHGAARTRHGAARGTVDRTTLVSSPPGRLHGCGPHER